MRQILFLLSFAFIAITTKAQSLDPTKLTQEDMKKIAAMTPAEQAAWKEKMLKAAESKLVKSAAALNISIDKTVLPTTKLVAPVKDLAKLAALPTTPPTRQRLLAETAKMEAALKASVSAQTVQQVESIVSKATPQAIQQSAIGGWYKNDPQAALLLGMKSVQKNPDSLLNWNNLAAMLNMAGMQHQAIPILQRCLVERPNNSMLLNNMGQAYMGLGDLGKAKQFLDKCLSVDDMHPEANHSMALLYIYDNNYEKAVEHFQKEMEIAHRRSSLAQLVKSGHRNRINLASLRKRKMQRDGVDNRNFFEEINLGLFKIPEPPMRAEDSERWRAENVGFMQSLMDEAMFWDAQAQYDAEQAKAEGKRNPGFYADLVNELIVDLGNKYIPIIGIVREDDVPFLTALGQDYTAKDKARPCPQPPLDPGNTQILFEAYEKKCCDLKTPLVDEYMYRYNSFIAARISEAQSNYKQYINGLISVIQLNPSPGNKRLVYSKVSNYFSFLISAMQSFKVLGRPDGCKSKLTPKEVEDIIKSARQVNLKCPDWLKLSVELKVAKLEADCEGYSIEADIYKLIQVGAEKKFETGTSTLYVGGGIDGDFRGLVSGEIKQQFYIVFDNNNQFADLGMRGSASGNLASGAVGAEFTYDIAMNAGFNAQGEVKSEWIDKYEKTLGYVTKW